jgi:hypothetical protein
MSLECKYSLLYINAMFYVVPFMIIEGIPIQKISKHFFPKFYLASEDKKPRATIIFKVEKCHLL